MMKAMLSIDVIIAGIRGFIILVNAAEKGITVYQGIVDKINISADRKKQLGMGMKGFKGQLLISAIM
jgi:hypothetical protein